MSNLKLPTMTYVNLLARLGKSRRPDQPLEIAYATTIEHCTGFNGRAAILVKHHKHPIAVLQPDNFTLDNCGYHTVTTSNRLNTILRDNNTAYRINIKNGEMILTEWHTVEDMQAVAHRYEMSTAHFSRALTTTPYVYHVPYRR